MSLITQINDLVTQIGTEFKNDRTKIGDLSSLSTTAKSSLVAALNELSSSIAGGGGASINDASATTTSVYSSQKVTDLITAATTAILGGAPTALDTLKELADALGDDASYAATITTALGNRLQFDAVQTLTTGQKAQGISNLGAISATDVGDVTTNFVTVFTAALA